MRRPMDFFGLGASVFVDAVTVDGAEALGAAPIGPPIVAGGGVADSLAFVTPPAVATPPAAVPPLAAASVPDL